MRPNLHRLCKFKLTPWLAAALLASFCLTGVAHAVGLGRINVLSRLGQPFSAEIELVNVARDDIPTLRVNLAPPAAYQASNQTFDQVLNTLRLSVEQRANGSAYIRATTVRRVNEPYLHLLVELNTLDGKFQRGYSALLDLPDVADPAPATPAPVAAAPAPSAPAPQSAPRSIRPPRPAVAQGSAPAVAPAPVAPAPAAVVPAPTAPVASPPANAATARPEANKPAEPTKAEPAKPAPTETTPATAVASKPESTKPEAKAPAGAPAAESKTESPSQPPAKAPPLAPASRSVVDTLMNYMVPVGAGVLALLAGIAGLWAWRSRKSAAPETLAPIEPTVTARQPEVAAPAAATDMRSAAPAGVAAAAAASVASHAPAPPETTVANASDTIDPIDEAKVYLEHMQDEQAEKILRDALSKQPGREDVQMMLLEILAGRGDKDGFNQLASRLHKQTGGLGANWKRAMAMGFAIDPDYPLYSPTDNGAARDTSALNMAAPDFDVGSASTAADDLSDTTDILLNRDGAAIDMDKTMVLVPEIAKPAAPAPEPLPDIMFELPAASTPSPTKPAPAPAMKDDPGLDFKIDFSSADTTPALEPATTAPVDEGAVDAAWEAVQQKIELGRAYREMGDKEGAVELLREAEREGDAGQQAEARELLQSLEQ